MHQDSERKIEKVKSCIVAHPDFPQKGIIFRDLLPVFRAADVFRDLISVLVTHIQMHHSAVDVLVGLEARGFLLAPVVAYEIGASFVPIRKQGKLPGDTYKVSYDLEYGKDCFEVQKDSIQSGQKVVIIDDLLATGGTMAAACELIASTNAEILECLVVIELSDLNGRSRVPGKITSLVTF